MVAAPEAHVLSQGQPLSWLHLDDVLDALVAGPGPHPLGPEFGGRLRILDEALREQPWGRARRSGIGLCDQQGEREDALDRNGHERAAGAPSRKRRAVEVNGTAGSKMGTWSPPGMRWRRESSAVKGCQFWEQPPNPCKSTSGSPVPC